MWKQYADYSTLICRKNIPDVSSEVIVFIFTMQRQRFRAVENVLIQIVKENGKLPCKPGGKNGANCQDWFPQICLFSFPDRILREL